MLPDQEIRHALDVARYLARSGVPIFLGQPDPEDATGYGRPKRWQATVPDPGVVDHWRPGMALCAVMGAGLDLIDIDPRSGGDVAALSGCMPNVYGVADTPSGGRHLFVASLGAGSRDGVLQGIDVKGGLPDGSSRGFAFLAPTVRRSKVDGNARPYRWTQPPLVPPAGADRSGERLAGLIGSLRAQSGVRVPQGLSPRLVEWLMSKPPHSVETAEAAIRAKLLEVASHPPQHGTGFRRVLLAAAMTLAGYVGTGYLDQAQAVEWLEAAVSQVWGQPDEEDRLWIRQAMNDGTARPFYVYTPEDEQAHGANDFDPDVIPVQQMPTILTGPFDPQWCVTDQEYAEAVLAYLHPVLRYAADAQTWIVQDGDSWSLRGDLAAWAVSTAAACMPPGTRPVPKKAEDRTEAHWRAWRRDTLSSSRGASGIAAKIRSAVAAGRHASAVQLAELDADPLILWAGGVPFDLRSGRRSSKVDLATPHLLSAGVLPDTAVSTPRWSAFLAAVWPDPAIRAYALRVLSVALAGYPDAVLPVLYGDTRTGKTSVADLLVRLLRPVRGHGYGGALDPDLISNVRGSGTKAHLFELKGRRVAFLDESIPAGRLATERLKQLTGGGALTADPKYGKPVTFDPTHTIVITSNDPPPISDPAVRARIRLLPCDGDVAAVKATRAALAVAWDQEAPGILAQLLDECAAWLADRGSVDLDRQPAAITTAGDDLANDQDLIGEWMAACCRPDETGTPTRDLINSYASWLWSQPSAKGVPVPSAVAFGRELGRLGVAHRTGLGPRKKAKGWSLRVTAMGTSGLAAWSQPAAQTSVSRIGNS